MSQKERIKQLINNGLLKPLNLKLYSTQAFGREITLDIRNIIQHPKVMFDVGANVGQTVDLWHREFVKPTIHSFEPVERLYKQLDRDFGDQAVCNHLGVGDKNEEITIHYGKHDVSHSFVYDDVGKGGEKTRVVTLDSYCDENTIGHIDVLKIDVEGFEHQVIDGASGLLAGQKIDILEIEVGFNPDGYYTFYPDLAEKLRTHNYQVLGFYDQTTEWDGRAELLFCNALFARKGLSFAR